MEKLLGDKPKPDPKATEGDEDYEKIIKPNTKAWRAYDAFKTKSTGRIAELENKIKEIESKPKEAPADAGKIAEYEAKIKALTEEHGMTKKQLAEIDYRQSDDFKRDYVEKYAGVRKDAIAHVQQLTVSDGETSRPATESDFDTLAATPLASRRRLAQQMFGDNGADVLDYVKDLARIRSDSALAVQRESERRQKDAETKVSTSKASKEQYKSLVGETRKAMEVKYPNLSLETYKDDPELSDALKDGYKFVDELMAEDLEKLPPEDKAFNQEAMRFRAGAALLLIKQLERERAEKESLKTELAKYRKSDPGDPKGPTPGAPVKDPDDGMDINSMVARIDKAASNA